MKEIGSTVARRQFAGMCLPGCREVVVRELSRRRFLCAGVTALAASAVSATSAAETTAVTPLNGRVIDLTHPLDTNFPTYSGQSQFKMRQLASTAREGWNFFEWVLSEHVGTHFDAPCHKAAGGLSSDQVPAEKLVAPLAVVDIRTRADRDPNAAVTVEDLREWEKRHGPLPRGGCVAMASGWARHVGSDRFRNPDAKGVLHFPGFSPEAAEFLLRERAIVGLAVDTLSLDPGESTTFAAHVAWLGSGRWGLECVANLEAVPPKGATIVVGAPKVVGASGGPSRVFALV